MSDMIIDLSNYKDRVGARVPAARYRVQVEDVEATKSSNNNPMINVWFRIVGGDYDGATIVDRLTLSEKALFRVVGFMQAIGLKTPKKRIKLNIQAFVGKTLEIDVEDGEPYNGRVKSEVRGYHRAAGNGSVEPVEDELAGLDEFSDSADLPEESIEDSAAPAEDTATKAESSDDDEVIDEIDLEDVDL